MTNALATSDDYALLIGPVSPGGQGKLDYMLLVASSVVVGVAPGLLPWWQYDPGDPESVDPGPVPPPAVLVTCQGASALMLSSTGVPGQVTMEKVGLAETEYSPNSDAYGILPNAWRQLLRPWRYPEIASIKVTVPHPSEYLAGYGGQWWLWGLGLEEFVPPDDGWGGGDVMLPGVGLIDAYRHCPESHPTLHGGVPRRRAGRTSTTTPPTSGRTSTPTASSNSGHGRDSATRARFRWRHGGSGCRRPSDCRSLATCSTSAA